MHVVLFHLHLNTNYAIASVHSRDMQTESAICMHTCLIPDVANLMLILFLNRHDRKYEFQNSLLTKWQLSYILRVKYLRKTKGRI